MISDFSLGSCCIYYIFRGMSENLDSLRKAVAVSPDNLPLLLMLGDALLENFIGEEAAETFEAALKVEPSSLPAKLGYIRALDFSGKVSEAILRLDALCEEHPDSGDAFLLSAKLHLKEVNGVVARQRYDKAISLDPELVDVNLLKRIEQAGGSPPPKTSTPTLASANSWQGGAYGDQEDDDDSDSLDDLRLDFLQKADIGFEDVGGMEEVKKAIRMKILLPLQQKEIFEAYGKKAGGGVLLYGPPGCGKTLISKATAGEINANFFSIGLHQILEMWIGKSEQKLHEIFELARSSKPSVLFFDEIDALAADRRDMRGSAARTLINQFLSELDGDQSNNEEVLVLGATNAPWHLDSAFLRPGRFDRLIFVPPPDEPARKEIVEVMSKGKPLHNLDVEGLAKKTNGYSGADIKAVFDRAIEAALEVAMESGEIVPVSNRDISKARKQVKPSTAKWFESAKNYALYANQSGFYDEVLEHLGLKK